MIGSPSPAKKTKALVRNLLSKGVVGREALRLYSLYQKEQAARQWEQRLEVDHESFSRVTRLVDSWEEKNPPKNSSVLLVNLSSRTASLSFNAAVESYLSWILRVAGHRVTHLTCEGGLPQCQHGVVATDLSAAPPCRHCHVVTRTAYPSHRFAALPAWPKGYDPELVALLPELEKLSPSELRKFAFEGLPLGELTWNGTKWSLRLGDPELDPGASRVHARFIIGAAQVARTVRAVIEKEKPVAIVAFNGVTFAEAVIASIAEEKGIRLVTYESGYRNGSTLFKHGRDVTNYEILVPESFELDDQTEAQLDRYLEKRFKGKFSMAGVEFWPEIKEIDPELREKIVRHKQTVAVFTNVVFDTSQAWGHVCFENMFEWLETTMRIAKRHPETLFVVRAHPDEAREVKKSRQSVGDWLKLSGWGRLENVHFIGPTARINSYRIIELSKFVLIYNSQIGIEAALTGKTVLTGAKTRFHTSGAVEFEKTPGQFEARLEELLVSKGIDNNARSRALARRFYYFTMFKGFMGLRAFLGDENECEAKVTAIEELRAGTSRETRIILDGILRGTRFCYE